MKLSLTVFIALILTVLTQAKWTIYCEDGSCPNTITDITPIETEHGYSACIAGGYSFARDEDHSTGLWCATQPDLSDFTRLKHFNSTLVYVAIAASPAGTIASAGMGIGEISHMMYSLDRNVAYNSKAALGAYGQDIKAICSSFERPANQQLFASVGTLDVLYGGQGLFLSEDSGQSWANKTIPIPYGDARYVFGFHGKTAGEKVIFVSGGTWPSASSRQQELLDLTNRCLRLSQHYCQPAPDTMSDDEIKDINSKRVYTPVKTALGLIQPNGGYIGFVLKSFNRGETWEAVFSNETMYNNDIHCSCPLHCATVTENSGEAFVFVTWDGGKTWEQTLSTTSSLLVSFFRIRFVSENIGFVTGGRYNDETEQIEGLIYKTVNGGRTWKLDVTLPDVAIIIGLNFNQNNTVGFAVGSTQSQQAIIARFDIY